MPDVAVESSPRINESELIHDEAIYTYSPLPRGETFRYMTLEPGGPKDGLRCSLRTALFTDTNYEALSYVWGTETRDHNIICDGHLLKITKNLHDALTRLRTSEPRTLWVDSICINQRNIHEKTHQLDWMGRIYASAHRVLVYMGPDPDDHAPRVKSLLSELRARFDDELAEATEVTWSLISYPLPNDPVLTDPRWTSLDVLLQSTWFQRGWVVREAGLAQACEVLWGSSNFDWTDLMWTACWLMGRTINIASLPSSYSQMAIHLDAYWDRHNAVVRIFFEDIAWKPNRLLDYLVRGRHLEFTDRRDTVFAFLDLATGNDPHLTLEYDQHPIELCRDFAVQYLHKTGDVTLLEFVAHGDQMTGEDLPTWAPNWDHRTAKTNFDDVSDRYLHSSLMPANGISYKPEILEGGLLRVRGAVFDVVESLTDVFHPSTTTPQAIYDLWCQVQDYSNNNTETGAKSREFLADQFVNVLTDWGKGLPTTKEYLVAKRAYCLELLRPTFTDGVFNWDGTDEHLQQVDAIHHSIRQVTNGIKFMVTKGGSFGLAPTVAQTDDLCGIIFGCVYPCLLRASGNSSYQFAGSVKISYFSTEKGCINGSVNKGIQRNDNESKRVLKGYCLRQGHDEDRVSWDVVEQDILLR